MAKKRPIVNIDNKPEIHLDKELFQNEVLRPVLKMQHEITLKLFLNHITNLSIEWNDLKKSKKTQTQIIFLHVLYTNTQKRIWTCSLDEGKRHTQCGDVVRGYLDGR